VEQRSPEWFAARLGKATASRTRDIVATTKSGGYTAGRKNYMAELTCERLTGQKAEQYVSAAMTDGIEREPKARAAYAFQTDVDVEEVGFIDHPTIPMCGASPDGLIGLDGLVEIKCCNTATHLETLLTGKIDPAYIDQMQMQMACAGPSRQWCDFVSYDERLPEPMQLYVKRVPRDDKHIAKLELEVTQFLIDLDATVDLLRKRYMAEAA
jgi:putative phage-type endonuclease